MRSAGIRIAVLAAAVKAVILWQLHAHPLLAPVATPDGEAYLQLSQRVIAGDWALGPGAYFVSPLYIYFQALVLGITGSLLAVQVVQILLGSAAAWLMWWASREWFGERAAWMAGLAAIATGLFTFYEVSFLQASLDPFLTAAMLAALTAGLKGRHPWWFAVCGLVSAAQVLNRPNVILALLAVGVALIAVRRFKPALLLASGVFVGLLPIAVRNGVVMEQLSFLPSHGGLNFYIGNAAEATGLYRRIPGIRGSILGQAVDAKRVAEGAAQRELTDAEVSGHFTGLALDWISEQPGAWVSLMAKKVRYTLHGQHIAVPLSYAFFAKDTGAWLDWLRLDPWLLMTLGVWGLFTAAFVKGMPWNAYWPFLVTVPALVLSVALFFMTERYRLPLLVPLVIGTGAAIDVFVSWIGRRDWSRVVVGLAVVLLGVLLLNRPLDLIDADGRMEERVKMAEAMARAGQPDEADRWLSSALTIYPYPESAYYRLASILADHGYADRASQYLRAASQVRTEAAVPDIWLQAGRLAARLEQVDTAVALFQRGVAQLPNDAGARDQLAIALLISGNLTDARVQFLEAVRLEPRNADAWAHLGYIAAQQGARDEALEYTSRALALNPLHELAARIRTAIGGGV